MTWFTGHDIYSWLFWLLHRFFIPTFHWGQKIPWRLPHGLQLENRLANRQLCQFESCSRVNNCYPQKFNDLFWCNEGTKMFVMTQVLRTELSILEKPWSQLGNSKG